MMESQLANTETEALLSVRGLKKHFPVQKGLFSRVVNHVRAVDGISFDIRPGETLGLVGESGSGKTTAGRSILRLLEPTAGEVYFHGQDVCQLNRRDMQSVRRQMQIIFQDPYSSLNPRKTVGDILSEVIRFHKLARSRDDVRAMVVQLLNDVGLPENSLKQYPRDFSGGQRQRIGIARALALKPEFIVADEPVSALDVSIQAQVINLMVDLQERYGLTWLFIAHDLSVVEYISDRVAVMYLGKIVEIAPARDLYANPIHPYTEALMNAIPIPDPDRRREKTPLEGDPPSPSQIPQGCAFHPRCPVARPECREAVPDLVDQGNDHQVACLIRG